MDRYCFVTIDTEEDQWGSIGILDPSVRNIAQLGKLQDKCDEYGVLPTYLINYPVATDQASRKIFESLIKSDKCEIGTHCHPWNTPPIKEELTKFNSYLCNLPTELVEEKLIKLHDVIYSHFGVKSKVFRAGRWGFGKEPLAALEKLGYKVDTSITPYCSWNHKGGPKYNCQENNSFYLEPTSFDKYASNQYTSGNILEIPPTMGYLQKNEIFCHQLRTILSSKAFKWSKLNGLADITGMINYRWLSPETSSAEDMIKLANRRFANGCNYVNMFFHSNSLLPAQTPFVLNKNDLEQFYRKLDVFFRYLVDNNIKPIKLSSGVEVCLTKR